MSDLRARWFTAEGADLRYVASYLRAHPFVDFESVHVVEESRRVVYEIDYVTVPDSDVSAAALAVHLGAETVASAHEWRDVT